MVSCGPIGRTRKAIVWSAYRCFQLLGRLSMRTEPRSASCSPPSKGPLTPSVPSIVIEVPLANGRTVRHAPGYRCIQIAGQTMLPNALAGNIILAEVALDCPQSQGGKGQGKAVIDAGQPESGSVEVAEVQGAIG
jgi:hypothetical protein